MEIKNNIQAFYAPTRTAWRNWLATNGQTQQSVWLIIYHKTSRTPSVYYPESIEEALCFGWIDSKSIRRDEQSSYLMFTPRKPKSKWSQVNKDRVEKLIDAKLMTTSGQLLIDQAKESGSWNALVSAQMLVLPDELQQLFTRNQTALKNFNAFPPSAKRYILEWILMAKKPETRQYRLVQTVDMAANNLRAKP